MAPAPAIVDSPFKRLKEQRNRIQSMRYLDLPVQGYDGMLIARYNLLDWDVVRKIAARHERSRDPRAVLNSQIDLMVTALDQFMYTNGDGEPKPLDVEQPMRFERRLADSLGFEAQTARQVAIGLFINEIALVAHHNQLMEWMTGEYSDVKDDVEGESEGPQS